MTATFHDLRGASVFITGGGSGIGAALTEGFLDQGARVAFIGRTDATGFVDDVAARPGNRPLFVQGDITDTGALRVALVQAILFLASDARRMMTGQVMAVDGGVVVTG